MVSEQAVNPVAGSGVPVEAAAAPAGGKSAGLDCLPELLFTGMPVLKGALEAAPKRILQTRRIPNNLTRIHMVRPQKPTKDPQQCTSRRPISLISTVMKALDGALCCRMQPTVKNRRNPRQYAYYRDTETGLLSTEPQGSVRRSRHVCLVSSDVAGALGSASYRRHMKALEEFGVEPRTGMIMHTWLRDRAFQERLRTNNAEPRKAAARGISLPATLAAALQKYSTKTGGRAW